MPFSITNKTHLRQEEVNALADCNLEREIIAIDVEAPGGPKIVTLSRNEVTCWQMFLRLFNCGNLARFQVHLTEVADYLNRYDWSKAKELQGDTTLKQASGKVCVLANKALLHKYSETLFNNVATDQVQKRVEFTQFQDSALLNRHDAVRTVGWNPYLQAKHVRALLEKTYTNARISLEDSDRQVLSRESNLSLETLKTMSIRVEQHLPPRQPPQVVVVHTHPTGVRNAKRETRNTRAN